MPHVLPEPTASDESENGVEADSVATSATPVSLSVEQTTRSKFQRRKIESILLALIAVAGVWWLRITIESKIWCVSELLTVLGLAALLSLQRIHARYRLCMFIGLLGTPLVFAILTRNWGAPIAFEMTAISSLGVLSLAMPMYLPNHRSLALSVVTSGFLTLFTALFASEYNTLVPAIAWMTLCLWHMVANHWERVESCTPQDVRRTTNVRPLTVIVGLTLFVLGGWFIHGRASEPTRLPWGFMPTSGGSSWSDPAARSGVGSGDAAIAAKDHAESFGAVESDLFLESTQSTLFDMFSDSIGQPKLKVKWERRQGMTPEKLIHAHQRTAQSERSGASFSTARDKPPPPQPLNDAPERAAFQWIGPTGIRLALNRYDAFDGVDWTLQANWRNDQLSRYQVGEEAWFMDPPQAGGLKLHPDRLQHGGVLKIIRLNSTHIPAPMMTAAVHVKDVDRRDFFGIDHDGSLYMPGREKIPSLTVMHLAKTSVMQDELVEPNSFADRQSYLDILAKMAPIQAFDLAETGDEDIDEDDAADEAVPMAGELKAESLAIDLTSGISDDYQKLQAIVSHLRENYVFDRQFVSEGEDPLNGFFVDQSGGDHLFATAAALMARAVGFNTRLVSGFYVRPSAVDIGMGQASVLPEDVHFWVEVQLNDGRWMEIEPTPSYRQPIYEPSSWLLAKRFAIAYWPHGCVLLAISFFVYLTRVAWFELGARVAWCFVGMFPVRFRVRLLLWILQCRARLAGKPRCTGTPQRDWLLSLTSRDDQLTDMAVECCDVADRMAFGVHGPTTRAAGGWSHSANLLIRHVTTRYISRSEMINHPIQNNSVLSDSVLGDSTRNHPVLNQPALNQTVLNESVLNESVNGSRA
ncbi:MAG: transglutaminase-like domain-containing protein [Planctomycetota bacterium]